MADWHTLVRERDFPMLEQAECDGRALIYLDNAATTQCARPVQWALENFWQGIHANPYRGAYCLGRQADRTLEETRQAAYDTACVTHNHPEGIKGAEATATVIWAARNKWSKAKIRKYVEKNYYPLNRTCDEIRPGYHFDVSCQGTVPVAITAFLEGNSFEDVIRTAVSLGGDCDTLTCIAGGMAEAFYGVPDDLKEECRRRIEPDMLKVLERFDMITASSQVIP